MVTLNKIVTHICLLTEFNSLICKCLFAYQNPHKKIILQHFNSLY